ncbi:MAG: FHA domain-containing protein [Candidatus Competibacteraceae bacterium]|nr:MAG: FHA domain-containing protein [Candidatus Competibacteraceae bacterium]
MAMIDCPVCRRPSAPDPDGFCLVCGRELAPSGAPLGPALGSPAAAPPPAAVPTSTLVLAGKHRGRLTGTRFLVRHDSQIGRGDPTLGPVDLDLGALPDGDSVSRRHARLLPREGGWLVEDVGSHHGTYLDGRRLERGAPERLRAGDTLAFGRLLFLIQFDTEDSCSNSS